MGLGSISREELSARFGERFRDGREALDRFDRDQSHLFEPPVGVVAPADAESVQWLVLWARRHRVPLVARGAGTSLDGESVPPPGGLVLDLLGWNRVIEIRAGDGIVRVDPGVVNHDLQRALAPDHFFPPNPGSWRSSTVGGNVATNASGPRSFRYGPTRAWVRGAPVVLGTGELLLVGSPASKRSIGPDLLQLLVGSEGTLGIFTELTLAIAPRPLRRAGLVVPLPDGIALGTVARELDRERRNGLSALEYLDATCAAALAQVPGARIPAGAALLLLEVESDDEAEEFRRLEAIVARLRELGVVADASVYPSADELWDLRGASGPALDRELGSRVREDVCVPVSRLDELLSSIDRIARDAGVRSAVFGHLGEGNLHPNFAVPPGSVEGEGLRSLLLRECLRLGGSISGEHGIGRVKRDVLVDQVGAGGRSLLGRVKSACDPDGILNPGNLLAP
ncbi:MAG TPA: FAD-binding oxidoreductase [Thermoplasmata archaeon]